MDSDIVLATTGEIAHGMGDSHRCGGALCWVFRQ
jgi:hypothetical protein